MPYALDPEIAPAFALFLEQMVPVPRGDWRTLRETNTAMMVEQLAGAPAFPAVERTSFTAATGDGASIALRWYAKAGAAPGSAVVYAHGGGMIMGSVDLYDPAVADYVDRSGVPFLSVEYRLAPEAQGEIPARDVVAALAWLQGEAAAMGIDPARIALMGDSAGGGIAAGAAILARDRKLPVARQILIYPMLDDRNLTPLPALEPFAAWSYDDNFTGWSALLGDALGTEAVSPVAAPARLTDCRGLPPAYIEVGDLDIFRDEDIAYAQRLAGSGVPVEFHVHPGAPHGFEWFAPQSQLAIRAMADRIRVIRAL